VSLEAQVWIAQLPMDACGLAEYRVLHKLADVAAKDGSRAWRNVSSKHDERGMAEELGCSARTVQRALRSLEVLGLIKRGDQKFVQHIRADRRPTVWDLPLTHWVKPAATPELDGVTTGVTPSEPVDNSPRGDSPGLHGVTPGVAVGTKGRTPKEVTNAATDRAHEHDYIDVLDALGAAWRFCAVCGLRDDGRVRIDWTTRAVRPVRRTA
jgi:DNA-binding HxlR family transcriptional regulator